MKTVLIATMLTAFLLAGSGPASALDHVTYLSRGTGDICTSGYHHNSTETSCDGVYVKTDDAVNGTAQIGATIIASLRAL